MILSHFKLYDTHHTLIVHHEAGPPDDPWRYARQEVAARLEEMNIPNPAEDLYRWGDWVYEDKAP